MTPDPRPLSACPVCTLTTCECFWSGFANGYAERARHAALVAAAWALYHNIVDENGRKYAANDDVLARFRAALDGEPT